MTATSAPVPTASERRVDPSMEEILASIRKIIADEESTTASVPSPQLVEPPPVRPASPPLPSRDLWRRPASVTPISPSVATQAAPQTPAPAMMPPVAHVPRPPLPSFAPPSPPAAAFTPPPVAMTPSESVVAPSVSQTPVKTDETPAVAPPEIRTEETASVLKLPEAAVRADEGGALVSTATKESIATAFQALSASVALTSAETVDRHVRDMLRPMLRTWLDDNLPVIVERLVRVEIERVARGGR